MSRLTKPQNSIGVLIHRTVAESRRDELARHRGGGWSLAGSSAAIPETAGGVPDDGTIHWPCAGGAGGATLRGFPTLRAPPVHYRVGQYSSGNRIVVYESAPYPKWLITHTVASPATKTLSSIPSPSARYSSFRTALSGWPFHSPAKCRRTSTIGSVFAVASAAIAPGVMTTVGVENRCVVIIPVSS